MKVMHIAVIVCFLLVLTSCGGIQNSIIGKWQNVDGTLEFLGDGTFITSGATGVSVGTYKFIDDKRVTVEFQGLYKSFGTMIFEVSVSGDELTWKYEGGGLGLPGGTAMQYKKVK